MASLVPWKERKDKYEDGNDDDENIVYGPRLVHSINECCFINKDETNAKAMKSMRMKKWW